MLHNNLKSFHMCLALRDEKPVIARSSVFFVFGKDMVNARLVQFIVACRTPSLGSNTSINCSVFQPDTMLYLPITNDLVLPYGQYTAIMNSSFVDYACRQGDQLLFNVTVVGSSFYPLGLTACAVFK